ncbi:MAG: GDP-mannose 4,6-dehydratase [Candidatus Obscuribacterales bacterium]|nr:GDP-mannose 4,6-dehydratase [Candidatus Obscuribacterales bacterium]
MKILVSGGCGFIGLHTAQKLSSLGHTVLLLDNLSRPGTKQNLKWLQEQSDLIAHANIDLRNSNAVDELVATNNDIAAIIHLGAQVAVTTSVTNPRLDFEINALGTFNLLEAARIHCPQAAFLYSSTNKVYGEMLDHAVIDLGKKYAYADLPLGVSEKMPLDFHSPYGCSKGSADQYVIDYSRIYGLKSVVFRQSCIYGSRQFGLEDQGWVAWFAICAILGNKLTIYGDGKQVRDVLWIDDLVDLYISTLEQIEKAKGQVYNIGGGAQNTLSPLELISLLEKFSGKSIDYSQADWRPGDQKVFISDISKVEKELGWKPCLAPEIGVEKLFKWTKNSQMLLKEVLQPILPTPGTR